MDYFVIILVDKLSIFVRGIKYIVLLVVKGGKLILMSDKILIDRDWIEVQIGIGGSGSDYDISFNQNMKIMKYLLLILVGGILLNVCFDDCEMDDGRWKVFVF